MSEFNTKTIITLFNDRFIPLHNTKLVCGEDEPIYLPADKQHPHHRIIFAHGFFASALHEISHWCIAGKKRRELEDFGYWYQPDGRSQEVQNKFEEAEIKPQALEWIFSISAGFKFNFSADNLGSEISSSKQFEQNILHQVEQYLSKGMPKDAKIWSELLIQHYRPNHYINLNEFIMEQ